MKTVKTKARWWVIPDALWKKIAPLLPKRVNRHPFGGGRPPVPARKGLNGILFVLRTGCQWNALNATGICRSSTAHARFQAWRRVGVFAKLWARGLREYARVKGLDWSWQSMDGTMSKAPLGGAHTAEPGRDHVVGLGNRVRQNAHILRPKFGELNDVRGVLRDSPSEPAAALPSRAVRSICWSGCELRLRWRRDQ